MSQFQLSDEDDAPKKATPPKSDAASTPAPQINVPEKASEFHFFPGEEPKKELEPAPVAPAPVSSAPVTSPPVRPSVPPKAGPKPLQPRAPGNASLAPNPISAKSQVVASLNAQVAQEDKHILTAQQLGMEPTDSFSATLFGVGASAKAAIAALEPLATWVLRLVIPVAIMCLAYLVAAIFMGGAKDSANPKFADVLKFSTMAASGLKWSLLGTGVSILVLAAGDRRYGAIIAASGVVLAFGTSYLTSAVLGASNPVGKVVSSDLRFTGGILLVLGLIKATFDLLGFLLELPAKMREKHASVGAGRPIEAKQRKIAQHANMFSPCWELPFCRESVRVLCPAFLAKKRCWKFGRGCYCDEEMIGRIVRGEPIEVIKAPTKMSKQKPPCGNCYIYLEHQSYKFRMLSPLALPATIALCFSAWPIYSKVFMSFNDNFNKFWSSLSFDASKFTPDTLKADPESAKKAAEAVADAAVIAGWAQNILGVVLGFLALIYISKAIEWLIFKAKL